MADSAVLTDALAYELLSVVSEIPCGCVATYGQLAKLIGRDKYARLVGRILSRAEYYGSFPCHRVVNPAGRTAPGFFRQRALLEEEGVTFLPNGCVDLSRYLWNPGLARTCPDHTIL